MSAGWSEEKVGEIVEAAWRTTSVRCPTDGTPVYPEVHKRSGGYYFITAFCRRCSHGVRIPEGEGYSKAEGSRTWTDAEKAALVDQHFQNESVQCPIDRAALDVSPYGHGSVSFFCYRCGNSHFYNRPE